MSISKNNTKPINRHIYDIDPFEINDVLFNKLKNKDQLPSKYFNIDQLAHEETQLLDYLQRSGYDIVEIKSRRNFIIPADNEYYLPYLSYKLLIIDHNKIGRLLTYQSNRYKGTHYASQDNFVGLIEHSVYELTKSLLNTEDSVILTKIMSWVELNNKDTTIQSTRNTTKKSDQKPVNKSETIHENIVAERPVFIISDFANRIVESLSNYFPTQKTELINFLTKNEFNCKLIFNGKQNQLVEFFKRSMYNQYTETKSIDSLAEWIINHFTIKDTSNNARDLNIYTVNAVLRNLNKEPSKNKRILTNIVPYKSASMRKKS